MGRDGGIRRFRNNMRRGEAGKDCVRGYPRDRNAKCRRRTEDFPRASDCGASPRAQEDAEAEGVAAQQVKTGAEAKHAGPLNALREREHSTDHRENRKGKNTRGNGEQRRCCNADGKRTSHTR